jgi:hypothetical protein
MVKLVVNISGSIDLAEALSRRASEMRTIMVVVVLPAWFDSASSRSGSRLRSCIVFPPPGARLTLGEATRTRRKLKHLLENIDTGIAATLCRGEPPAAGNIIQTNG